MWVLYTVDTGIPSFYSADSFATNLFKHVDLNQYSTACDIKQTQHLKYVEIHTDKVLKLGIILFLRIHLKNSLLTNTTSKRVSDSSVYFIFVTEPCHI